MFNVMEDRVTSKGEIMDYKKELVEIIKAWESLDGDKMHTADSVEHWLATKMHPAICKARTKLRMSNIKE